MYGLVEESVGDTRYNTKGIKLQREGKQNSNKYCVSETSYENMIQ